MMDYQVFLTYIVLALIIAIIIHMLFRAINTCYNNSSNNESFPYSNSAGLDPYSGSLDLGKNMNGTSDTSSVSSSNSSNNSMANYDGKINCTPIAAEGSQAADNKIPNNLMSEGSNSEVEAYDDDDYIGGISNRTPNLVGCTTCDVNNTYTKEFIMDESVKCPTKEVSYSRDQLQDYRDGFFGFRSHLWQQSASVDPVDRINERLLSGDGSIESKPCEKISDVYDSLTGDRVHKKHCVMTQNLDNISMSPQYRMPGTLGDYYVRDNWMYNYDHVMNGALFYDGVSGMDPLMNDQMALN
jgi:hypothetical protein